MVAKCVTVLSIIPVAILANITGPPPGVSGVPGESTCAECHSGQVNTTGLAIEAAGGMTYTPGTTQRIKVTINANPAAARYGPRPAGR